MRTSFAWQVVAAVAAQGACAHPSTQPSSAASGAPSPAQVAAPASPPSSATAASGYDRPPQNVLDVLHAATPPQPLVSPTAESILLVSWVQYPPIERVAEPFLRLGGARVEPRTRRKHDTPGGYGITPCAQRVLLVDVATRRETPVALPNGGCVDDPTWSADGKWFAFRNTSRDAVEPWIGDGKTGAIHRLAPVKLNPMLGDDLAWMPDQRSLLVKLVPDAPGPPPTGAAGSTGPSIQETDGKQGEFSTYEARDTLTSKLDEALFEYYATSQLATIDVATGAVARIGAPATYLAASPSPDGNYFLISTIQKPYSYVTTYPRFANDIKVWDRRGTRSVTIAKLPVAERVPIGGVPTGPRDVAWRANAPATVVWAEALDGGDWNVSVPARDKLMMLSPPFTGPAREVARTEQRLQELDWGEQGNAAFVYEYDDNRHWERMSVLDLDATRGARPAARMLWSQSSDEEYKHPGRLVHRTLANGQGVVQQDGAAVYLAGRGATPDGDRAFLDRLDLVHQKTERLFRSDATAYERFLAFVDGNARSFLTWHQSQQDPPNVKLRTLGAAMASSIGEAAYGSTSTPITHLPDPAPAVRAIKQRLVKYKRKDGVDLSFTLMTPPGYQEGTRIPAVLYAYPLDYASSATAGQVVGSQQRFAVLRSYQLLLLSGYAIIDLAAFPIVGDPRKAYDTYLEQLTENARAAVDKAVELGVVDRDRIGVTGHSHGALMTANLIAHTDLFRAGVATSGSYNKTLTPFGFQNERRSVWKNQSVYLKVSPFFFADKMKLPLLIVHGADDANPGTTPLQAVKLYEAIRGNGGTARLVMLPHEPHSYTAMESNEQLAYEELRWFDKYVKNAEPRRAAAKASAAP